jgi:uncharacterized DUF497 family protein
MRGRAAGFEWDAGNWPKCGKHGVSRAEIERVIAAARFAVDDPSPREKCYRTAGRAPTGRHVFVVFTYRERGGSVYVRPISARYMHRREIESYEKEVARLEER